MQAFGIGGFAPKPGGFDALVAKALGEHNFDLARQLVNAAGGGSGFVPSPTTQQLLDRALQNAIANGNFDDFRKLQEITGKGASIEQQLAAALASGDVAGAQRLFSFANQLTPAQRLQAFGSTGGGAGPNDQTLAAQQQVFQQNQQVLQAERDATRAQLQNRIAAAKDQREADAARSELARFDAQEADRQRAANQAFQFGGTGEARTAERAALENRLANARDQREADAARQQLALLDAQEGRAASAFPLSQELLRNQDTRAAAQQAFSQGLQNRQFGLQEQGQAFGQAQQRLQSGLEILRSPGDQFLFQTRLRGNQPNQAFQLGGTAVSRNAFLEPFGQQAFGTGQGQAFGSLLRSEGGRTPPGAFGIGSGLQQAVPSLGGSLGALDSMGNTIDFRRGGGGSLDSLMGRATPTEQFGDMRTRGPQSLGLLPPGGMPVSNAPISEGGARGPVLPEPPQSIQGAFAGFGTTGNINDLSRAIHAQAQPPMTDMMTRGPASLGQMPSQEAPFSISPGLQQAFAGQQVGRPRQLPSLGAPPFLSLQQNRNLLPSEREMRQAEVQAQGFFLPDFEEQERRQNPQAFLPSGQRVRRAAAFRPL